MRLWSTILNQVLYGVNEESTVNIVTYLNVLQKVRDSRVTNVLSCNVDIEQKIQALRCK